MSPSSCLESVAAVTHTLSLCTYCTKSNTWVLTISAASGVNTLL